MANQIDYLDNTRPLPEGSTRLPLPDNSETYTSADQRSLRGETPLSQDWVDQIKIANTPRPLSEPLEPVAPAEQYVDVGVGSEERAAQLEADTEAIKTDMSESFLGARGTFYRVPLRTGSGSGLYAVESLSRFVASAKKERAEAQRRLKFDSRHESHVEVIPEPSNPDLPNPQLPERVIDFENPELTPDSNTLWERRLASIDFNQKIDSENARRTNEDRVTAQEKSNLASTPILIMGISLDQADIVSAVSCLGNIKVFYTFGQAFGNVHIRGEMLLGPLGNIQSDGVRLLSDYFDQQRVSNLKRATTFSIAKTAYQMYLTGLTIGDIDVQFHVLPFMLTGTLIDPSNQNTSKLNPANQVNAKDEELTLATVSSGAALAAQTTQTTQTGGDFLAFQAAPFSPAPTISQAQLHSMSPADIEKIDEANQRVVEAELTGDADFIADAVQARNTTIESVLTKSPVGQKTEAGASVNQAVASRPAAVSSPAFVDVMGAAVQQDARDRSPAAASERARSLLGINPKPQFEPLLNTRL